MVRKCERKKMRVILWSVILEAKWRALDCRDLHFCLRDCCHKVDLAGTFFISHDCSWETIAGKLRLSVRCETRKEKFAIIDEHSPLRMWLLGRRMLEKTRVSDALPYVRQRRKVSADYVCLGRGAGILARGRFWSILPQVNNWQNASVVFAFQLKVMTVLKMQRHVWNLWDGKWRKTWKRRQDTKHRAYRWDNSWHVTQSFSRVSLLRCGSTKSIERNSKRHATIQWFFVAQAWFKQKYEEEFATEEITSRAGRHQPCTSQLVKLRNSTEFYC